MEYILLSDKRRWVTHFCIGKRAVIGSDNLLSPVRCPAIIWTYYSDVIMGAMVSQFTSPTTVYSTVYSRADQRKFQSSASLAFVRRIHRWPNKRPVTRKMFPFDDVIMQNPMEYGRHWQKQRRRTFFSSSLFILCKFAMLLKHEWTKTIPVKTTRCSWNAISSCCYG